MNARAQSSPSSLLQARIKIPQHVVYRDFPTETVVLNLQTGKYHGLNPTAGHMLEILAGADSVAAAAATLAADYGRPEETILEDISELCESLLARDLIELSGDEAL